MYLVVPLPSSALILSLQLRSEDAHSLKTEAKTGVYVVPAGGGAFVPYPTPANSTLTSSLQLQREVFHSKMSKFLSIQG